MSLWDELSSACHTVEDGGETVIKGAEDAAKWTAGALRGEAGKLLHGAEGKLHALEADVAVPVAFVKQLVGSSEHLMMAVGEASDNIFWMTGDAGVTVPSLLNTAGRTNQDLNVHVNSLFNLAAGLDEHHSKIAAALGAQVPLTTANTGINAGHVTTGLFYFGSCSDALITANPLFEPLVNKIGMLHNTTFHLGDPTDSGAQKIQGLSGLAEVSASFVAGRATELSAFSDRLRYHHQRHLLDQATGEQSEHLDKALDWIKAHKELLLKVSDAGISFLLKALHGAIEVIKGLVDGVFKGLDKLLGMVPADVKASGGGALGVTEGVAVVNAEEQANASATLTLVKLVNILKTVLSVVRTVLDAVLNAIAALVGLFEKLIHETFVIVEKIVELTSAKPSGT